MSQWWQGRWAHQLQVFCFFIFPKIFLESFLNETPGGQPGSAKVCCLLHCGFSFPQSPNESTSAVRSYPHPPALSASLSERHPGMTEVCKRMSQPELSRVLNVSSRAPPKPLLEVIESRHQEEFLEEEFRVQHSDVSGSANQGVGRVGQGVEHVVSD